MVEGGWNGKFAHLPDADEAQHAHGAPERAVEGKVPGKVEGIGRGEEAQGGDGEGVDGEGEGAEGKGDAAAQLGAV